MAQIIALARQFISKAPELAILSGVLAVALLIGVGYLLVSKSPSSETTVAPTPESSAIASAIDAATPQHSVVSAQDAMLTAGIENPIYLEASRGHYCVQPVDVSPWPAKFVVQSASGRPPFISEVPFRWTMTSALMVMAHLTLAEKKFGMMRMELDCYSIDPLPAVFVQTQWGPDTGLLLGTMRVSSVELVNEFSAQGPTGPTKAQSYHVAYRIERPPGARPITGVDGVTFTDTCILYLDNVENRWAFDKCTPTNPN